MRKMCEKYIFVPPTLVTSANPDNIQVCQFVGLGGD